MKVDLYGVRGQWGTAYHGFAHLPEALGRRILEGRVRAAGGVPVPAPGDALAAHAYHAAYHKAEQSGLHWRDAAETRATAYTGDLEAAMSGAGLRLPLTGVALHNYLVDAGYGIEGPRLRAYLRHDFAHGRKVHLHARLLAALPGEMNLFVVREVAARTGLEGDIVRRLAEHFEILAEKPVPWLTRFRTRTRMRGGKWRRGGKPCLAVVVFDHRPVPSNEEEQRVHPFVFNRNQFVKQHWREWFVSAAPVKANANPVHSTDNEAEAIGHLPLFFTEAEQRDIVDRVAAIRGADHDRIGRYEGD